jgi:hypothetical protein
MAVPNLLIFTNPKATVKNAAPKISKTRTIGTLQKADKKPATPTNPQRALKASLILSSNPFSWPLNQTGKNRASTIESAYLKNFLIHYLPRRLNYCVNLFILSAVFG